MAQITEKQLAALKSLSSGAALIPIVHFGALHYKGLVTSAKEELTGRRGYAAAKLSDAGRAALSA